MNRIVLLLLILATTCSCNTRKPVAQQELSAQINAITAGKKAVVAVSIHALDDSFKMDKNGDKMLPLLSVFKLPVAIALLELVDQKKYHLNDKILIKKQDLLDNTYSPFREKYPEGNVEVPLRELLHYMVAVSDNNITDVLIKLAGGTNAVQTVLHSKGVKNIILKVNEAEMHTSYKNFYLNTASTNALNALLQNLFKQKLLSPNSTSFLMKTLYETKTGANKIKAQLPNNIPVAHKTGSSGKNNEGVTIAENDVGIISLPNGKHYALSILVSNSKESEETNTKLIANISKATYEFLNKP